ncbi:MAG: YidC/Oxa1 family insertase periplasmic-domain containing protein, partial [candidate division WOR-3 bacterium]
GLSYQNLQVSDTSVAFSYQLPEGTVVKTWTIEKDYTLRLNLLLTDSREGRTEGVKEPSFTFDVQDGIAITEENRKEDLANFHFYARKERSVHQVAVGNLRKKPLVIPAPDWAGVKSKYFFLALVSEEGEFDSTQAFALSDGRVGFIARGHFQSETLTPRRFLVYLGPIEYNRLRAFGLGFENVVSLGWLKPIALGILYLLRLFYQLVRNWGWAIVLFSGVMKGVFYPLTRTQTRQMRQLQLLQPKIEELKQKYKDDPKMLNQETMRLYQLYKVNPFSGCLPLIVQMPVFFALYAVLRNFIELRGAGFILWLKDLSQPDTLFGHIPQGVPLIGGFAIGLLPVLMGVSFIGQNLLTSTDRRNRAMTFFFPIFITAIFLNLSSGLQLYWFIYNILSIGESLIATKGGKLWLKLKKSPMHGVR